MTSEVSACWRSSLPACDTEASSCTAAADGTTPSPGSTSKVTTTEPTSTRSTEMRSGDMAGVMEAATSAANWRDAALPLLFSRALLDWLNISHASMLMLSCMLMRMAYSVWPGCCCWLADSCSVPVLDRHTPAEQNDRVTLLSNLGAAGAGDDDAPLNDDAGTDTGEAPLETLHSGAAELLDDMLLLLLLLAVLLLEMLLVLLAVP